MKRILEDGEDRRFRGVKNKFGLFFFYFFMQSVWAFVTAFPVYFLNVKQSLDSGDAKMMNKGITAFDLIGWAVWLGGFALQVTADKQKRIFRETRATTSTKEFITTGVWAWCQHPNYFGEICMWFGIFLSCWNELEGVERLSVLSPCFVFFLLRYVSGVPLLRRAAKKRFGNDPLYKKYIKETNILLPNPFKTPVRLD